METNQWGQTLTEQRHKRLSSRNHTIVATTILTLTIFRTAAFPTAVRATRAVSSNLTRSILPTCIDQSHDVF
ncbi:MAG TPA: hypothetical protein VJ695_06340 [Nitrososphaera sp.]|nr:hypothetical protein [Nitrososphaera sp.]